MKVQRRDPAALARRRARAAATVGAAIAVGTAGLMVLAVGTAAAAEPGRYAETPSVRAAPARHGPGPAASVDQVPVPTTERSSTTVIVPGHAEVWATSGARTSASEDTPRPTPGADPTPGD